MSDLQLSLLAASGVAIVGVFAYNKWQEWRHRKVAQAVFADEKPDVLMAQDGQMGLAADQLAFEAQQQGPGYLEPVLPSLGTAEAEERREPSLSLNEELHVERVEPTIHSATVNIAPNDVMSPETVADATDATDDVAPVIIEESTLAPVISLHEHQASKALTEYQDEKYLDGEAAAPALADMQSPQDISSAFFTPPVPRSLAHSECDAVMTLELVSGVTAGTLLSASQGMLSKISKPVFWIGVNAEEQWQVLGVETSGVFKHLRLVVQLADRQGPISEAEIYLLQNAVQTMAVDWNAVVDVSDLNHAIQRAHQLDQFCVQVDLQIGINLVGHIPFPGTKIRALAEAAGMSVNQNGAFEKQNDDGLVLFTLSNQEATPFAVETLRTLKTHGLTFVLDVPRVSDTGFVYDHMLRLAKQFAEALQAKIVDDNRRPLSDAQLANIREQFVAKPQLEMAAKRIPPGSLLALRLFS